MSKTRLAEVVWVTDKVRGGIVWNPNDSCLPERHRPYISADLPLSKFIERWAEINGVDLSGSEKKRTTPCPATLLNQ